jgi:hypothetical protein
LRQLAVAKKARRGIRRQSDMTCEACNQKKKAKAANQALQQEYEKNLAAGIVVPPPVKKKFASSRTWRTKAEGHESESTNIVQPLCWAQASCQAPQLTMRQQTQQVSHMYGKLSAFFVENRFIFHSHSHTRFIITHGCQLL